MKIHECKNVYDGFFSVKLLSSQQGGPLVQFGQGFDQIPLDEARKIARAILAIPRPSDAGPEAFEPCPSEFYAARCSAGPRGHGGDCQFSRKATT